MVYKLYSYLKVAAIKLSLKIEFINISISMEINAGYCLSRSRI